MSNLSMYFEILFIGALINIHEDGLSLYKLPMLLTLYNTLPTFNDPKVEGFGKHYAKRRKCWKPAFSLFRIMFTILSKRDIIILAICNLASANALNFIHSKKLPVIFTR